MASIKLNMDKVVKAANKGVIKRLSGIGAYVRSVARRSIRRVKRSSAAGSPPHSPSGKLKNAIRFGKYMGRVIIGPTKTEIGLIGKTHEYGGIEPEKKAREKMRRNRKTGQLYGTGQMTIAKPRRRYPARPFMRPALKVALPRIPRMLRGSIKQ